LQKNAIVQKEGEREVIRQVEYFNLDAIIPVGYRVKSTRLLLYYAETPLMVPTGNDLYARQIASYDV